MLGTLEDRLRIAVSDLDPDLVHDRLAVRQRSMPGGRLQRVPLRRMGTVAEVVSSVVYLASDEASYITGSELVVDGGALAQ